MKWCLADCQREAELDEMRWMGLRFSSLFNFLHWGHFVLQLADPAKNRALSCYFVST